MTKNPLCVAFLWHMHQPDYGDVRTGEIYLPWTRFHAVKDYYDMAALSGSIKGLRLTINVVPSLIDQLDAYAGGSVRETYAELTLRNPGDLDERERLFLLRSFFQLPWERMLQPHARYRELLAKRGTPDERGEYREGLKQYAAQDYTDLQTWFNLAWCGHELSSEPDVAELFRKGRGFTEEDKRSLMGAQYSFIGKIIPLYRQLSQDGNIELSVSPYYHPILPLLCDLRSAREALPHLPLPEKTFSRTADAVEQIERAQERFRRVFGTSARGMWPSEGAVSNCAADLAARCGLSWIASDEGVLLSSSAKSNRGQPSLNQKLCAFEWNGEGGAVNLYFRDQELSNRIGFVYSNWNPREAAADFLFRLRNLHRHLPDEGRHYVAPIILDGENAWEHYPENGREFLKLVYSGIVESADLRAVTLSEFLQMETHREPLEHLVAGSWIYSNLATWIGHPEKNLAWELVAGAREELDLARQRGRQDSELEPALREMMIAEGSDWYWWYGDDHPTQNAAEFDALFRAHVKNVYRLIGQPSPRALDEPIKKISPNIPLRMPARKISPRIDGRVTDYFEWLSAGFAIPGGGESMHRTFRYLEKIHFGFDEGRFYLRVDLPAGRETMLSESVCFRVHFAPPVDYLVSIERRSPDGWCCRVLSSGEVTELPECALERILELKIPLQALRAPERKEVHFAISVLEGSHDLERFPTSGYFEVPVDPVELEIQQWIV